MIKLNFIKKYVSLFFIIGFCCFYAISKDLTLMSFNIQGHGPGSTEHRFGKKWESLIVDVIKKSKADIVMLQEVPVYSEDDLNNLLEKLNGKWKGISSFDYSVSSSDLNNAVLYNEKYVTFLSDLGKKHPFNLHRYNLENDYRRYKFIKNNEQILEFSCKQNPNQVFYIVNVHLPAPKTSERLAEQRQLELLYADYKRKVPIIIAGDFNTSRLELLRGSNFSDGIIDGTNERYSDVWGQKTTVKDFNWQLANDFDHFIMNNNSSFTLSEQMHIVFGKEKWESFKPVKIGKSNYTESSIYKKDLSDHLPIMIKFKILAKNDKK